MSLSNQIAQSVIVGWSGVKSPQPCLNCGNNKLEFAMVQKRNPLTGVRQSNGGVIPSLVCFYCTNIFEITLDKLVQAKGLTYSNEGELFQIKNSLWNERRKYIEEREVRLRKFEPVEVKPDADKIQATRFVKRIKITPEIVVNSMIELWVPAFTIFFILEVIYFLINPTFLSHLLVVAVTILIMGVVVFVDINRGNTLMVMATRRRFGISTKILNHNIYKKSNKAPYLILENERFNFYERGGDGTIPIVSFSKYELGLTESEYATFVQALIFNGYLYARNETSLENISIEPEEAVADQKEEEPVDTGDDLFSDDDLLFEDKKSDMIHQRRNRSGNAREAAFKMVLSDIKSQKGFPRSPITIEELYSARVDQNKKDHSAVNEEIQSVAEEDAGVEKEEQRIKERETSIEGIELIPKENSLAEEDSPTQEVETEREAKTAFRIDPVTENEIVQNAENRETIEIEAEKLFEEITNQVEAINDESEFPKNEPSVHLDHTDNGITDLEKMKTKRILALKGKFARGEFIDLTKPYSEIEIPEAEPPSKEPLEAPKEEVPHVSYLNSASPLVEKYSHSIPIPSKNPKPKETDSTGILGDLIKIPPEVKIEYVGISNKSPTETIRAMIIEKENKESVVVPQPKGKMKEKSGDYEVKVATVENNVRSILKKIENLDKDVKYIPAPVKQVEVGNSENLNKPNLDPNQIFAKWDKQNQNIPTENESLKKPVADGSTNLVEKQEDQTLEAKKDKKQRKSSKTQPKIPKSKQAGQRRKLNLDTPIHGLGDIDLGMKPEDLENLSDEEKGSLGIDPKEVFKRFDEMKKTILDDSKNIKKKGK